VLKGNIGYIFYSTHVLFQGDFGGPLVVGMRPVGIYAWGSGRGLPSYTDVYTKVSAVFDWIVINAVLLMISAVINWIKTIPGLKIIPLTFFRNYSNN
jgi:secreted trypsin-like serine protease